MKLSAKIVLGFTLTNIIFLILVMIVYLFLRPVQFGSNDLTENSLPLMDQSSSIMYSMTMENYLVRSYLLDHNEETWKQAMLEADNVFKKINEIAENLKSPNSWTINIPSILGPFNDVKTFAAQYHKMVESVPRQQETLANLRNDILTAQNAYLGLLDEVRKLQENVLDQELSVMSSVAEIKNRISRLSTINTLIINSNRAVRTMWMSFATNDPELLNEALLIIDDLSTASAKFHEETINAASRESSGQLVNRINEMEEKFRDIINLQKLINKEGAERVVIRDHLAPAVGQLREQASLMAHTVANDSSAAANKVVSAIIVGTILAIAMSLIMGLFIVKSITSPINQVIAALSEGAQEVDNASSELSSASNILAEGATENAASLEETSAALEELSSMTMRNADNAHEANALMVQASEAIGKADHSMHQVIRSMEEISISGNEIGKIIKTIDEIAFQTNLLALNASVEAARAGDAGAGFAVVADEVRNLAIRSTDAAKSTADLIASTIFNITSGSDMVNATAETFKIVESHSKKVAELVAEVAAASKEQSQGISQITTAMGEMDKVTQSNAASAEQAASSAGQLSLQAGHLLEAVDAMTVMVHGAENGSSRQTSPKVAPQRSSSLNPKARTAHNALSMDNDFDL